MRHLVPVLVSLVALLTVPVSARAQDTADDAAEATPQVVIPGAGFDVAPDPGDESAATAAGYFVYELAPGKEATGRLRLRNTGGEPVTVELVAVDAETAQTGGSAFAATEATPGAVGTWIRLEEPQVDLAAGEQVSVGFLVQPPADTRPGQYLAGIAAYMPAVPDRDGNAAAENQAGAGVIMQTRYVVGVQVDVPGEWTPSLEITQVEALEQPSGTKLGITIRNNGDTFLKPEGSVTLTNADTTPIVEEPIQLDTVVTGTGVTYPIDWPGAPQAGEYGVDVELNYAEDKVARYRGMLAVGVGAPAAQPAPGEATQPGVVPVPAPQPSPISMWVLYAIVGLLALIIILLVAVLVRSFRRRG